MLLFFKKSANMEAPMDGDHSLYDRNIYFICKLSLFSENQPVLVYLYLLPT